MNDTYRVLVTGSRSWTAELVTWHALDQARDTTPAGRTLVIVHGGCPKGADQVAHNWAQGHAVATEVHPADWATHGRAAGPIRNQLMVRRGADLCLAFIHNGSRGASHTAGLAEAAGIPTRRFTIREQP
ncbi:DUF2493 domain-containing protein [Streptomyces reniochalinae]